jgi:hypothetical protein
MIGDTLFGIGTLALTWFIFGLAGAGALKNERRQFPD